MQQNKKAPSAIKNSLHPRNKHRGRYDLDRLIEVHPDLGSFVHENAHGNRSIDFFDPKAVLALNKALILHHYGLAHWEIPEGYLCPPVPGRADYIHHMAHVLGAGNGGVIPKGPNVRCLDIGVGASCIYPIIGRSEYGWSFIGSEIDAKALESAKKIVAANPLLTDNVQCALQTTPANILHGVLQQDVLMDLVICNPPFHSSAEAAKAGSMRKQRKLKGKKVMEPVLNFGGQANELWTEGGEVRFILRLIEESRHFAKSCYCYSSLVSKESHLKPILKALTKANAQEQKVIPIAQGNKASRIVTWSFLRPKEKASWAWPKG